jgi:hypothetical protein
LEIRALVEERGAGVVTCSNCGTQAGGALRLRAEALRRTRLLVTFALT